MNDKQRLTLNITAGIIAVSLVVILAAATWALSKWEIPDKNHDLMVVLVTAVTQLVGMVVAFFFGSSSSNKSKDDSITTLATVAAASVPPAPKLDP